MTPEPRQRDDYGARQIQAAHRVLVDLGQVLASFKDSLVVVGGWTPDLLLPNAESRTLAASMWIWPWMQPSSAQGNTPS